MSGEQGLAGGLQAGLQAGQQSYQQGVGTALQLNQIKRQQLVELKRSEIFRNNPPPKNPSMDEAHTYLSAILPQLVQVGDTDMVRSVTELLKSVQAQKAAKSPQSVDLGDKVVLRDPTTGEIVYEGKKGAAPRAPGDGPAKRLVPVMNPKTGKPELAEYDPASGGFKFTGQQPGAIGSGSEMERKAMALMEMAAPMVPILEQADAPNRITMLARERRLGEVLTAEQQQNDIAGRMIMDAYLRLTTGAAYNAEEMRNSHTMLVPMPGDAPTTIALKRKVRQSLIRALKRAAGRAYDSNFAGAADIEGIMGGGVEMPDAGGLPDAEGNLPPLSSYKFGGQ
jgi:hypothetical protein